MCRRFPQRRIFSRSNPVSDTNKRKVAMHTHNPIHFIRGQTILL